MPYSSVNKSTNVIVTHVRWLANLTLFRLELNMELCNIVNQESRKTSPEAFDLFD